MALTNIVVAGDYDGAIYFKNKKKGLYIHRNRFLRPSLNTFINKETVESYEVISEDSHASMGSGVIKGAVGGALFGGVGAIAGANSAKKKGTFMVSIVFKDGTKCLCELDTEMYKNLVMVMY